MDKYIAQIIFKNLCNMTLKEISFSKNMRVRSLYTRIHLYIVF